MNEAHACSLGPDLPWPLLVAVSDLIAAVERLSGVPDAQQSGRAATIVEASEASEALRLALGDLEVAPASDRPRLADEARAATSFVLKAASQLMPAELRLHVAANDVASCAKRVERELSAACPHLQQRPKRSTASAAGPKPT